MPHHRRRPYSQPLAIILGAVGLLAILAYFNRGPSRPENAGATTAPSIAQKTDATPDQSAAGKKRSDKPDRPETALLTTQTPTSHTPTTVPTASIAKPSDAITKPVAQAWDKLVPQDKPAPIMLAAVDAPAKVADAARAQQSGDLLTARSALNAALLSGRQSADEAARTRQQLTDMNKTIILSTRRFPDDPFGGTYQVQNGDSLQKIAKEHNVTWELLGRINDISDPRKLRAGRAIKIINGPFHAVVNKGKFEMEIWLGQPFSADSMFVGTFPVGLGKSGSTPTGSWIVTPGGKQKNPKFWGTGDLAPMEADDPKNPLGEFWIALTGTSGHAEGKDSYGIHGTIEPDSIGKEASHGCIRLRSQDIAVVYEMLVDGKSTVVVRE